MKRLFLILLLLLGNLGVFAQVYDYYYRKIKYLNEINGVAKKYNIKEILVIDSLNIKKNKPTLIKSFNTKGYLVKERSYFSKTYEDYFYDYYPNGQLKSYYRIYSTDSLAMFYNQLYYINDKINYVIVTNNEKKQADTIKYYYLRNNSINFTHSTLDNRNKYHNYYKNDQLLNISPTKGDTIPEYVYDKNGCLKIWYVGDEFREFLTNDSACELLEYQTQTFKHGRWVSTYKAIFKYINKQLAEEKRCDCFWNISSFCNGRLLFRSWSFYEYFANGLESKEVFYNKRKKKISTNVYKYTFYN